jgi:hypothetical protein
MKLLARPLAALVLGAPFSAFGQGDFAGEGLAAETGPVPLATHPLWARAVDRVPLDAVLETRSSPRARPAVSKHAHNAAFPAQVFENVCLRFESEVRPTPFVVASRPLANSQCPPAWAFGIYIRASLVRWCCKCPHPPSYFILF